MNSPIMVAWIQLFWCVVAGICIGIYSGSISLGIATFAACHALSPVIKD